MVDQGAESSSTGELPTQPLGFRTERSKVAGGEGCSRRRSCRITFRTASLAPPWVRIRRARSGVASHLGGNSITRVKLTVETPNTRTGAKSQMGQHGRDRRPPCGAHSHIVTFGQPASSTVVNYRKMRPVCRDDDKDQSSAANNVASGAEFCRCCRDVKRPVSVLQPLMPAGKAELAR